VTAARWQCPTRPDLLLARNHSPPTSARFSAGKQQRDAAGHRWHAPANVAVAHPISLSDQADEQTGAGILHRISYLGSRQCLGRRSWSSNRGGVGGWTRPAGAHLYRVGRGRALSSGRQGKVRLRSARGRASLLKNGIYSVRRRVDTAAGSRRPRRSRAGRSTSLGRLTRAAFVC
jgi:hypothetical protein